MCWIERAQTQPFSPFEAPCEDHKSPCRAGETRPRPKEISMSAVLPCGVPLAHCSHPRQTHLPCPLLGSSNPCLSPVTCQLVNRNCHCICTVTCQASNPLPNPRHSFSCSASRRWLHCFPILTNPAATATHPRRPQCTSGSSTRETAQLEPGITPRSQSI